MAICSICGYRVKVGSLISLHLFPSDPVMKSKWLKALQRTEVDILDLICSIHFTSNCFDIDETKKIRVLRPDSIPSKYLHSDKEQVHRVLERYQAKKQWIQWTNRKLAVRKCTSKHEKADDEAASRMEGTVSQVAVQPDETAKLSLEKKIKLAVDLAKSTYTTNTKQLKCLNTRTSRLRTSILKVKTMLRESNQEVSSDEDEHLPGTTPEQNRSEEGDNASFVNSASTSELQVLCYDLTQDSTISEYNVEDGEESNNEDSSFNLNFENILHAQNAYYEIGKDEQITIKIDELR